MQIDLQIIFLVYCQPYQPDTQISLSLKLSYEHPANRLFFLWVGIIPVQIIPAGIRTIKRKATRLQTEIRNVALFFGSISGT